MRLAIILSLALDRRSGRVHGADLLPADEAVTKVKQLITSGKPLDPRFPIVEAVAFSTLREHRFNVDPAELAAWKDGTIREATKDDLAGALEEAERKLDAAAAANAAAAAVNAELLTANEALKASDAASADKIAVVTTERDEAKARIEELEAQLAEPAKKKK